MQNCKIVKLKLIKVVSFTEPNAIAEAAEILQRGGSVVYPTDTVYGLGVNPFDDFAVRRLFRIKKRPASKPIPLIVKSVAMARKLAYINARKEKILRALWPGAVSVVLYKRDIISSLISAGGETVSLRIPKSDFCAILIKAINNPITSTSANISGEQATNDPMVIRERFQKEIYKPDLVIDAGILDVREPSTVLDFTLDKPKVLRVGPVKLADLKRILEI